jgi:septum formation protein
MDHQIVLASASPRRAELLANAGFVFTVRPADVDETRRPDESPDTYVRRIAIAKARAVDGAVLASGTIVLAADTTVVVGGEVLGKPSGPEDARRMLTSLAGTVHQVLTGVVVRTAQREACEIARTDVHLIALTPEEIAWYVESGEPEGKAGAYAIQGRAARFVDRIEGSWSNVVGLPVATVYRMLKRAGA